jgi:cytoskeletal protein RodZ
VESLGNKLRLAREDKGYSYDSISRDTNIAIRYLDALEREDFSVFPGEPYLLGFLKNYGEYLGLESAELLSLYRALKIQEQPVPMEQLLRSPSRAPRIITGIVLGLIIFGAAGGGFYFIRRMPGPELPAAPEVRAPEEYTMSAGTLERRFYRGDSILIPSARDQYKLELVNLGETVTISTPSGTVILDLSQELQIDLDRDGLGELRITVTDFVKHEPASGALLRFELVNYFIPPGAAAGNPEAGLDGESAGAASQNTVGSVNVTTIFTSPNPYPITLQVAFQAYCMFRWEVLNERDRRGRNEQYFQRTDTLSILAQNGVRIWASNAQAAKVQITGGGRVAPLELGLAGEVVVVDIRWVRDEDSRYRLALVRLE